jgi:hypothetical protein
MINVLKYCFLIAITEIYTHCNIYFLFVFDIVKTWLSLKHQLIPIYNFLLFSLRYSL